VKKTVKLKVKNKMGLHTRPATAIVKLLRHFRSHVTFTFNRKSINAKSILSILMLAARQGSVITITADGEDSAEVIRQLTSAFESEFGDNY